MPHFAAHLDRHIDHAIPGDAKTALAEAIADLRSKLIGPGGIFAPDSQQAPTVEHAILQLAELAAGEIHQPEMQPGPAAAPAAAKMAETKPATATIPKPRPAARRPATVA